jgi:hypothetical protein
MPRYEESTCQICQGGIVRVRYPGELPGDWWHEDYSLDAQHEAAPAPVAAIAAGVGG